MEWISQWFDRIFQSMVWRTVLGQFQWIDWLVVICLLVGVGCGIKKGFIPILGDILQLVFVIVPTLEFNGEIGSLLRTYLDILPADFIDFVAFVIAAAFFWWAIGVIARYLAKIISAQTSTPLRVIGGAFGGAAYAILLLSFASQIVLLTPWKSFKKVYDKGASYTGFMLAHTAPKIHQLVTRPFESIGLSKIRQGS